MNVRPYVISSNDAADTLELTYGVTHFLAELEPGRKVKTAKDSLNGFISTEIISLSSHGVPQLDMVSELISSHNIGSAALRIAEAKSNKRLNFIASSLMLIDEVEVIA